VRIRLLAICILFAIVFTMGACQGSSEGELSYGGPLEISVKRGETLPGTEISYAGKGPQGAQVFIGGQKAIKQKGDSLDWEGSPVPGAELKLNLRILWFDDETMHCGGIFTFKVKEPAPSPEPLPSDVKLKYTSLVSYQVKRGEFIPGTTVRFIGKSDQGAQLEGVEGYPYRKMADSIVWTGRLREGVHLRLNVRVVYFNDSTLRVAGTAEIIVT